jgi:acyl-CoA synthetase (NDP forming)
VVLDEWEGKQRLSGSGLPVPRGMVRDAAGAVEAAETIGYPVVVKLVSADLPHKTDAGAVKVGLDSADAVRQAV